MFFFRVCVLCGEIICHDMCVIQDHQISNLRQLMTFCIQSEVQQQLRASLILGSKSLLRWMEGDSHLNTVPMIEKAMTRICDHPAVDVDALKSSVTVNVLWITGSRVRMWTCGRRNCE
jgi:hypothetical protein